MDAEFALLRDWLQASDAIDRVIEATEPESEPLPRRPVPRSLLRAYHGEAVEARWRGLRPIPNP